MTMEQKPEEKPEQGQPVFAQAFAQADKTERKKKARILQVVGKRKKAIARATVREGAGRIMINSTPMDLITPRYRQMRIKEAILLAGELAKKVDISVAVSGGGMWGQADAARTAIANAIVRFSKDNSLKQAYIDYDRTLLISDARRTEPHKPSRSKDGPRAGKQQSKR